MELSTSQHRTSVNQSNILLLTATITPLSGIPILARTDPSARLDDYANALKFYLSLVDQCVDYIIFVENSNSDISRLRAIVDQANLTKSVEFIVFEGLDFPPAYGRGYGDFKCVEYAMNHSTILDSQPGDSIVWKVTGRYLIKNLCRIIATKPSRFDVYCHCRNRPMRFAEMYLIAWTRSGYQAGLKNIYQEVRDDISSEHSPEVAFRNVLEQRSKTIKIVPRFKVTPFYDCVLGYTNQRLSSEPYYLLKYYLRRTASWVMPWLWI